MEASSTNSNDPPNSHGNVGNNLPGSTNTTNSDDTSTKNDENLNENISDHQQKNSELNENNSFSENPTENNATNNSTQSITNPTEPLSTNNKNDQDDQNMDTDLLANQNNDSENDKQQHTDSTLNEQGPSQSNDTVVSFKREEEEQQRNGDPQNPNNVTDQNSEINPVDNSMDIEQNKKKEAKSTVPSLKNDLELGIASHTHTPKNEDTGGHLPNGNNDIERPLTPEVQDVNPDTPIPTNYKKFKFEDLLNSFRSDQSWLNCQYDDANRDQIKKPNEIEDQMDEPSNDEIDKSILNRVQGSIIGMAIGDALGAHVEFRPHEYLVQHPVTDLGCGGTWGLEKGQFTDDTSMALCLANSLIACRGFVPYDQLVRYKWWYKHGYMSSTGHCFDIGAATRQSIVEFERRQNQFQKNSNTDPVNMDLLSDPEILKQIDAYCSEDDVAGNGALMRLAPVPLFFYRYPEAAVKLSGISGKITHGDKKAYDACRYYGALIVAALHGYTKKQLLDKAFYSKHKQWFGDEELHNDIKEIAEGSYKKKNGYKDGIRGKGYIVKALEAALWAFWSDGNSFKDGALAAVNLGDDTDTTAAIYGQLAGAYYGYENLPKHWLKEVYAKKFMEKLSKWIVYEGERWQNQSSSSPSQS